MAKRVAAVAKTIVHQDQNGFLPGRLITSNTNFLIQATDYFSIEQIKATITMLDSEKAFDLVEWVVLFAILRKFSFPDSFVLMLRTLYSGAKASIMINNMSAGDISINRGLRQGCPMSPILFALFIEPLVCAIRLDQSIEPPMREALKLKLYADDMVLYLKANKDNVKRVFNKISEFTAIGGYKINQVKSEALIFNNSPEILPFAMRSSFSVICPISYLGIKVSGNYNALYAQNYAPILIKVRTMLNRWNKLPFTITGRVSLIKMNLLQLFLFAFSNVPVKLTKAFFGALEGEFQSFIWQSKQPRAKLLTLSLPQEESGLALPSLRTYYQAMLIGWLTLASRNIATTDNYYLHIMLKTAKIDPASFFTIPKLPKRTRYKKPHIVVTCTTYIWRE